MGAHKNLGAHKKGLRANLDPQLMSFASLEWPSRRPTEDASRSHVQSDDSSRQTAPCGTVAAPGTAFCAALMPISKRNGAHGRTSQ